MRYGIAFFTALLVFLVSQQARAFGLRIGGSSLEEVRAISMGADGAAYLAGFTRSFGAGAGDAWVVRIAPNGELQWQTRLGTGRIDVAEAISAAPDGSVYVAGHNGAAAPSSRNAWLMRLGSDGQILWQRSMGGGSLDRFLAVAATNDGAAIAGETATGSQGREDGWLVRFDANGNLLWQRTLGGPGIDTFLALSRTSNGGWIAAGSTTSFGATTQDPWVVRFDGSGAVLWQRRWNGPDNEKIRSIQSLRDGSFVAGGRAESAVRVDGLIARLNGAGSSIWQRRIEQADVTDVHQSPAGALLAAGTLQDGSGRSTLLKLSPGGSRLWQQAFSGTLSALPGSRSRSANSLLFATVSTFSRNQDVVLLQLDGRGTDSGSCSGLGAPFRSTITSVRIPSTTGNAVSINTGPAVLSALLSRRPSAALTMDLCMGGGNEQSRSGTFTRNPDTQYQVGGGVQLVRSASGSLELRLGSDFSSSSGPRLEVYLSNSNSVTGSSLTLGRLQSTSGAQNYAVPSSVNLDTYSWVIIHCVSFNVSFGYAQLR